MTCARCVITPCWRSAWPRRCVGKPHDGQRRPARARAGTPPKREQADQAGKDATIVIPEGTRIRHKALLLDWLVAVRVLEAGVEYTLTKEAALPLFHRLMRGDAQTSLPMSDKAVAGLVKRYATAAGYGATRFSGHLLPASFLTEAASRGVTIFKVREVSRHKPMQVLSDYICSADRVRDHAGKQAVWGMRLRIEYDRAPLR